MGKLFLQTAPDCWLQVEGSRAFIDRARDQFLEMAALLNRRKRNQATQALFLRERLLNIQAELEELNE